MSLYDEVEQAFSKLPCDGNVYGPLKFKFREAREHEVSDARRKSFPDASHWVTSLWRKCRREGLTGTTCQRCKGTGRVKRTVLYSMGSAHTNPPRMLDVVASLMGDAQCYENADTLDAFVTEYGSDATKTPVSEHIRAFKACRKTYGALKAMLGTEGWERVADLVRDY